MKTPRLLTLAATLLTPGALWSADIQVCYHVSLKGLKARARTPRTVRRFLALQDVGRLNERSTTSYWKCTPVRYGDRHETPYPNRGQVL